MHNGVAPYSNLFLSPFSLPLLLSSKIPGTVIERLGTEVKGLCCELWAKALPKLQLFYCFFSPACLEGVSVSPGQCICGADGEQE